MRANRSMKWIASLQIGKRIGIKAETVSSSLLRPLVNRIPKKKGLWVFGSWGGKNYSDNAKYLFEYVSSLEDTPVQAVWVTKERRVMKKLKEAGYRCVMARSPKGIAAVARAEAAFETEGCWDISRLLSGTVEIQLWHGMGYKSMKWKKADGSSTLRKADVERFNSYEWMSPSDLYTDTISHLLGVDKNRFHLTGYPRNDTMAARPASEVIENLKSGFPGGKLIAYMPTHRFFGKDDAFAGRMEELLEVDQTLKAMNAVMVFKPHFHEMQNMQAVLRKYHFERIILAAGEEWEDVYSYLHGFDLLISDYSSVLTDFMCTGKPVVLFPYDIDKFGMADAGVNDYYWTLSGGPICYSWREVLDEAEKLFECDTWKEKREECRRCFHFFNDDNNCKRVYNKTITIMEERKKKK